MYRFASHSAMSAASCHREGRPEGAKKIRRQSSISNEIRKQATVFESHADDDREKAP